MANDIPPLLSASPPPMCKLDCLDDDDDFGDFTTVTTDYVSDADSPSHNCHFVPNGKPVQYLDDNIRFELNSQINHELDLCDAVSEINTLDPKIELDIERIVVNQMTGSENTDSSGAPRDTFHSGSEQFNILDEKSRNGDLIASCVTSEIESCEKEAPATVGNKSVITNGLSDDDDWNFVSSENNGGEVLDQVPTDAKNSMLSEINSSDVANQDLTDVDNIEPWDVSDVTTIAENVASSGENALQMLDVNVVHVNDFKYPNVNRSEVNQVTADDVESTKNDDDPATRNDTDPAWIAGWTQEDYELERKSAFGDYESDDDYDDFGDFEEAHVSIPSDKLLPDTKIENDFDDVSCSRQIDGHGNNVDMSFADADEHWNCIFGSRTEDHVEVNLNTMEGRLNSSVVWCKVKDIESSPCLSFNWSKSEANKLLLSTLAVDSRNILFGPKWSSDVPRFAANLGFSPLVPKKLESVLQITSDDAINSDSVVRPVQSAVHTATPSQDVLENVCGTNNGISVPDAHFDWNNSGLTNPLESYTHSTLLDTELLSSFDMHSPYYKNKRHKKRKEWKNMIDDLMGQSPTISCSKEPSSQAINILNRLPDLSVMEKEYIVFPSS